MVNVVRYWGCLRRQLRGHAGEALYLLLLLLLVHVLLLLLVHVLELLVHLLLLLIHLLLLLWVHWRLGAGRAWSGVDGRRGQHGDNWVHVHLLLLLLVVMLHLVLLLGWVRVLDEVTVLPVIRVGIWVVVVKGWSHCLLNHRGFHCVNCVEVDYQSCCSPVVKLCVRVCGCVCVRPPTKLV